MGVSAAVFSATQKVALSPAAKAGGRLPAARYVPRCTAQGLVPSSLCARARTS